MRTKNAETATQKGVDGADFYLKHLKKLPDYYVLKAFALSEGWKSTYKFIENAVPGKMIGGYLYKNKNGKLPQKGKWYEADLDYTKGYRNSKRILWSDDGLIFVSFDHYQTFYEITDAKG